MKLIFAGFFTLLSLTACGGGGGGSIVSAPTTEQLTISGAGNLGIFDPSVTKDPMTNTLWMSYSSVYQSGFYNPSIYWGVSIRLASSTDNGVTWQDVDEISAFKETSVGPITGVTAAVNSIWQSEMSSLTYDPNATPGEEWKLIWMQYLHAGNTSFFAGHAWFNVKMAATPAGLASATTVKLFSGVNYLTDGENIGANAYSPTGSAPAFALNTGLTQVAGGADITELAACAFAEPGIHATSAALYLTLFCGDTSTNPTTEYIVHFRCSSPCNISNAASWEYLGRLLTPADAVAATSNHHFNAPAVVEKDPKHYLVVTPVDTTGGSHYNGCRVYEFTDINTNLLQRDGGGDLIEIARTDGDAGTHHGACGAFDGLNGGILQSQFYVSNINDKFTIFKTQANLP